jgi:ABC-type lipoprotein export system ATPase subunit
MKSLYQIKNLSFSYKLGSILVRALQDVTFEIPKDEVVCFSGPSGSGKTTLLNILGLIEPLQQGRVIFRGQDFSKLSEVEKNRMRRYHIGFIFQQFHLLPILTAEENVEYFLSRQGIPREERNRLTREALESVGLWEHRFKKTYEMSGGQRQRVAIARAMAKSPQVIIADEPTASLDQKTGREIMDILHQLTQEKKVSVLIASHDLMVHSYADKHYAVSDGQVTSLKEKPTCRG